MAGQRETVSRARDFIERTGWAVISAAAATALATGFADWRLTVKASAIAGLVVALKVIAAQNVGAHNDGAAIPGGVIRSTDQSSGGPQT